MHFTLQRTARFALFKSFIRMKFDRRAENLDAEISLTKWTNCLNICEKIRSSSLINEVPGDVAI